MVAVRHSLAVDFSHIAARPGRSPVRVAAGYIRPHQARLRHAARAAELYFYPLHAACRYGPSAHYDLAGPQSFVVGSRLVTNQVERFARCGLFVYGRLYIARGRFRGRQVSSE